MAYFDRYPTDLRAPGALDALFALHRATFGGWRMVDDPPADPPADTPPADFKPPSTQADLDRIISDRLTRQRAQLDTRYADYDAMKAKADAHDKAIADAQTEQEKAVAAARTEGKTEAQQAANVRLVAAEARALAAEAKFRNPSLAVRAIDLAGVKVGEDGEVDADAVKAKLKALADAEPYLVDDGKTRVKPDKSQGGSGSDTKPSVASGRDLYDARRPKRAAASA